MQGGTQIIQLQRADKGLVPSWPVLARWSLCTLLSRSLKDGIYDTAAAELIRAAGGPADYFQLAGGAVQDVSPRRQQTLLKIQQNVGAGAPHGNGTFTSLLTDTLLSGKAPPTLRLSALFRWRRSPRSAALIHTDQPLKLHGGCIIGVGGGLERLSIEDLETSAPHTIQCLDGDGGAVAPFTRYYGGYGFVVGKLFTCHVAGPGQWKAAI